MKTLITIILLAHGFLSIAQNPNLFQGTVSDSLDHSFLPYASIGIIDKEVGTVANNQGDFAIELSPEFDNDSLKISMIGYESKTYKVAEFKKILLKNSTINLSKKTSLLPSISVKGRKLKDGVLGNVVKSNTMVIEFITEKLGYELGIIAKIKRKPTVVKSLSFSIVESQFDSLRFRVNFYDLKDDLPNEIINSSPIIFTTKIKKGNIDVDLSQYNLIMTEDFFVSVEWIENPIRTDKKLIYNFSLFGSKTFAREASQSKWQKMPICIGLNLKVKH